jgi:hypothetical protein
MDDKSQMGELMSPTASKLNNRNLRQTVQHGGMAEQTTNVNTMMVSLLATQTGDQSSKDASKVTN